MAEIHGKGPGESAALDDRGPILLKGRGSMATRADISAKPTLSHPPDFAQIKDAVDQNVSVTKPSASTLASAEADTAKPNIPEKTADSSKGEIVQDDGKRNAIWRPGR
jgi:hypothetical protein